MADNPNEINAWNGWNNLFHPGSLIPYSWSIHWAVFWWGMPQMQPSLSSTNWNMTWKLPSLKKNIWCLTFLVLRNSLLIIFLFLKGWCVVLIFVFNSLEKNTMVQQNSTQPFWLTSYLSSLPFKAKPSPLLASQPSQGIQFLGFNTRHHELSWLTSQVRNQGCSHMARAQDQDLTQGLARQKPYENSGICVPFQWPHLGWGLPFG